MKKLDLSEERKQFDSRGRTTAIKGIGYLVLGLFGITKCIEWMYVSGANRGASLIAEGIEKEANNCKDD